MISFSHASISLRALLATVALVGVATFVVARSQLPLVMRWRKPCRANARDGRDRHCTNRLIATSPIGQAPQAITYVPNAIAEGEGTQGLQQLGVAGQTAHLSLGAVEGLSLGAVEGRKTVGSAGGAGSEDKAPTRVSLFDQGLIQVLQASVTGLEPKQPYVLALAHERNGEGPLEPLATFMTNPAGSGDRQRDRRDPAGRARRGQESAALFGHRRRPCRQARSDRAGTVEIANTAGCAVCGSGTQKG